MPARAWLTRLGKPKEAYFHHVREGEQEQFVAAERHLSAADVRCMRSELLRRKREEKARVTSEKRRKLT